MNGHFSRQRTSDDHRLRHAEFFFAHINRGHSRTAVNPCSETTIIVCTGRWNPDKNLMTCRGITRRLAGAGRERSRSATSLELRDKPSCARGIMQSARSYQSKGGGDRPLYFIRTPYNGVLASQTRHDYCPQSSMIRGGMSPGLVGRW